MPLVPPVRIGGSPDSVSWVEEVPTPDRASKKKAAAALHRGGISPAIDEHPVPIKDGPIPAQTHTFPLKIYYILILSAFQRTIPNIIVSLKIISYLI